MYPLALLLALPPSPADLLARLNAFLAKQNRSLVEMQASGTGVSSVKATLELQRGRTLRFWAVGAPTSYEFWAEGQRFAEIDHSGKQYYAGEVQSFAQFPPTEVSDLPGVAFPYAVIQGELAPISAASSFKIASTPEDINLRLVRMTSVQSGPSGSRTTTVVMAANGRLVRLDQISVNRGVAFKAFQRYLAFKPLPATYRPKFMLPPGYRPVASPYTAEGLKPGSKLPARVWARYQSHKRAYGLVFFIGSNVSAADRKRIIDANVGVIDWTESTFDPEFMRRVNAEFTPAAYLFTENGLIAQSWQGWSDAELPTIVGEIIRASKIK